MNTNKKLIAAVAVGVIGVGGFVQSANAVTGNASAVLVAPISITQSTALNFGSIANSVPAAGSSTFVINNDGTAPTVGTNLAQVGTAATRGIFAVSGTGNLAYTVTIPAGSITLTESGGAGHTMSVGTFTSRTGAGAGTAGTLSSGSDTVYIGATLTVQDAATNEAGTYNGTYTVTVAYN